MAYRSGLLAAGVTVLALSSLMAQEVTPLGKNCVVPKVKDSPEPPPSHSPRTREATVLMDILLDEKGKVSDPKILTSSGSDDFDRDAMGTVKVWRFKPAMCDGKPVATRIAVQVHSKVL